MKIYKSITNTLNRFRVKSMTHPMSFKWDGKNMKFYQNGSTFIVSEIFAGCFMPNKVIKGILLPKEINKFIEVQEFIDNNLDLIMISPRKWGYDIYKINTADGGNPLLVHELRFFSIKSAIPLLLCKLFVPKLRVCLKNV